MADREERLFGCPAQGAGVTERALIYAIEAATGLSYEAWAIGITDDPGRQRTEHGNPASWRSWQADREFTARRVEQGCRDKGMKGSPGGGTAATYVYIF